MTRNELAPGIEGMGKRMFSAGEVGRVISEDEALSIACAVYKIKGLASRTDAIREQIREITRK